MYPFLPKFGQKASLIKGPRGSVPRAQKGPFPLKSCSHMVFKSGGVAPQAQTTYMNPQAIKTYI